MISVVIVTPETGASRVERFEGVITVGRDPRCNVVLDARGVSGSHCRLSPMGELPGAYLLEDLASTYGTFVNNARVARPVVVSGRDLITVGGHQLLLAPPGHEGAAIARLTTPAVPEQAPAPAAPPPPAVAQLAAFDARAPWIEQFEHFDALARGWHESGRQRAKLLRGPAVAVAEQWLAAGMRQSPTPGALHRDFIEESRTRGTNRTLGIVFVVSFFVLVIGGLVAAFVFRVEIERMLEPPQIVVPDAPREVDDPQAPKNDTLELAALFEGIATEPDADRRLLLFAAAAELSQAQGKALLSDDAWSLATSVQGTLAERKEWVLRDHGDPVSTVAFSPDGQRIVSASDDGSARLWDFSRPAPNPPFALRGHIGPVNIAAFSAQGDRIATGGEDGKVWLWNARATDPAGTGVALRKHDSAVRVLAWHPSGRYLVTGDDEGLLVVWDVSGEPLETSRMAHEAPITALEFDEADPPTLWSGSDDRLARRWKIREDGSLARQRTLDEHIGGVSALATSPGARFVATGTTSGEVMLWPLATKTRKRRGKRKTIIAKPFVLPGCRETVTALRFTPDAKLLVAACGAEPRLWDVEASDPSVTSIVLPGHTGEVLTTEIVAGERLATGASDNSVRVWKLDRAVRGETDQRELVGHDGAVLSVDASPDGLRLVSGGADSTVRVWDPLGGAAGQGGASLRIGVDAVQDVAVSSSGLVLGVSSGQVKLWRLADKARWRTPKALQGVDGIVNAAAFDAQGRTAAVGTEVGTIVVWTVVGPKSEPRVLEGHDGPVNALTFLEDGRLISVSSDRSVRLWDVASGQATVWNAHPDEVHTLAVTRSGQYAFTGGLDGTLVRWTLADGASLNMPGHEGEVSSVRISADDRLLATASADRRGRVWDVASGKLMHVLRGHEDPVQAVAFNGAGLLATGSADRRILIWDLESEHPDESPRPLVGHEQSVTALAFSQDPQVLISASNDATVRLWRLDTDRALVLRGHDGVVSALRLSPQGEYAISASFDGTVRAWPLTHESLARHLCDVVGHGLGPGEATAALGITVPNPCE